MNLYSKIIPIKYLTPKVIDELFLLYETFFENVDLDSFKIDLSSKMYIIIARNIDNDEMAGFSTYQVLKDTLNNETIYCAFSGDTIVHKKYWGQQEMTRSFCLLSGLIKSQLDPKHKFYWLLISKGYKTYRILPVLFKTFHPQYNSNSDDNQRLILNHFIKKLYPKEYNPKTGLIKFNQKLGNLRSDIGHPEERHLLNKDINFFCKTNPDYINGTELACIGEFSESNLRSASRRYFIKGLNRDTQGIRINVSSEICVQNIN